MPRASRLAVLAAVVAMAPAAAHAQQDGPVTACGEADDAFFCRAVAQSAEALVPLVVLVGTGGNPVPGTASTLGMRLTSAPRWTIGARMSVGRGSSPTPESPADAIANGGPQPSFTLTPSAFALEGSVGVLPGWNPFPTVGGVASLDLLFGASVVPLLASDEYGGTGGWNWGAGARLGLLRESFTLPGVSVSAMYRQARAIRLGDEELQTSRSYMGGDLSVLSLRAAASKAVLLLNLSGGVGYDIIHGDLDLGYDGASGPSRLTADDMRMQRLNAFGTVSYTLMVLNFVLGAGWQEAPPEVPDGNAAGADWSPGSAFFGTLVLRLSI